MSTSSATPMHIDSRNQQLSTALPELPYSLHTRKRSIAITWFVIWFVNSALIQILYFALRYAAKISHIIALAVTVSVLGGFTLLNISIRIWRLVKKNSPRRPENTSPWSLDFFMWSYLLSFVVVTVVISSATTNPPKIRQASMPQAAVLYIVSIQILFSRVFDTLGMKTFCRLSSTPKGQAVPPASLVIMEDVVATDGGGGQEFRMALMKRYQTSEPFRKLLRQMDWFWGIGGLLIAVGVTLVIFLNPSEIVAFAVGWSVPFVWAAVWALITVFWVKRSLAKERGMFESHTV